LSSRTSSSPNSVPLQNFSNLGGTAFGNVRGQTTRRKSQDITLKTRRDTTIPGLYRNAYIKRNKTLAKTKQKNNKKKKEKKKKKDRQRMD
jgi:hypothetical protein